MLKYRKVHGVLTCAHILNEVISPDQICLICLCAYIGLHRFSMLLTLESFRRLHPLHSESRSWKATSLNCDVEQ